MAPSGPLDEIPPMASPPGFSTLPCSGDDPSRGRTTGIVGTTGSVVPPRLGADCWILTGPTAAGKTALALGLAGRLDAEIVSVDSMAVYAGLDVGTAKPTPAERAAVPHHAIDLVGPATAFNVAMWLTAAHEAVAAIRGRGRRILFVGGTPLYLRSLRDGLAALPADAPTIRHRLADEASRFGSPSLHARLASIDPVAAARIHPNDAKRIVRALEVAEVSGRPLSASWQDGGSGVGNAASVTFTAQMLVIDHPRRLLYDRIDRRVDRMFATGLVEETRAALQAGGIGPTASQAAGYGEARAVLEGRLSLAEAIDRTKTRTRQLAKRQLTWLRSFADAIWICS
jgi:tRNA dimethylallyltransferase